MLLAQDRRGHEHRHLLAVERGAERRAHRHLGLAVADVAADDPIHRPIAPHVAERVFDRGELIGRLVVGEGRLELLLEPVARREREALGELARCVHGEQLAREVAQRVGDRLLRLSPGLAAELVDPRYVAVGAGIALHLAHPVHRHEQPRLLGVLDAQELARDTAQLEVDEAAVDADAVLGVHEVVARRELRERLERGARGPGRVHRGAAFGARSEDLLLGDEREAVRGQREALGERGGADLDAPGRRPAPARARLGLDRRVDLVVGEQAAQPLGVRERARREHDPVARARATR